ncbi:hypothetical protein JD81_05848 [Micromonospora sagamiensis]|uniref:Uncharacterized protein n=1 Tax=Micromonospora sagamiensis TaxID=47875 RepID=A0A562WPL2_9ACTN|nr:hypothetical protein JD81_05848 [Micromonospora sagamiensis]
MLDSYIKDLDLMPPARRNVRDGGDLSYSNTHGFDAYGSASIAVWNERSVPTYADCRRIATAAGVESILLDEGQTICVLTDEGRVARLKLIRETVNEYSFDATVWAD